MPALTPPSRLPGPLLPQPAPRRLPHRAVRAYKSEEQASGGEEAAAAAAAEYYGGAEVPKALSSYDDGGGYEAAVMPQVDLGALSSDEEMPEGARLLEGSGVGCGVPCAWQAVREPPMVCLDSVHAQQLAGHNHLAAAADATAARVCVAAA